MFKVIKASAPVLFAFALLTLLPTTFAESTPKFGMNLKDVDERGHVVMTIPQGGEQKNSLALSNNDDANYITLEMSIARNSENPKENINSEWLEFQNEKIILAPKESKEFEYTVKIPAGTEIGLRNGLITATMKSYGKEKPVEEDATSMIGVKVAFAVGGNLDVYIVDEDSTVIPKTEQVAQNGEEVPSGFKAFLDRYQNEIIIGLLILAVIGVFIKKLKVTSVKKDKK